MSRLEAYPGQGDPADKGLLPDGRRRFVFSQSRLKQVDVCPERGRRSLLALDEDGASDSTALGRSVHSSIEACLRDVIDGTGPWHLDDMIQSAIEEFNEEMAMPSSRWIKYKTPETLHKQIARCLSTWYDDVLPSLQPVDVEVNFGPIVVHEDEERVIEVKGQIDYVDELGLADWKTTGRSWEPWEHQRWDVQPTLYIAAYEATLGADINALPDLALRPWTWHVLNVDGSYQRIETTRTRADWDWLVDRMVTVAKTLEADLPAWPKNDSSALCSPSWCSSYSACKGLYIPDPKTQRK